MANIYIYGVSERPRIRLVPLFLPDTRPKFRIPGRELPSFPLAPWGKFAKPLWALVWGKEKGGKPRRGEATRCDSILRQSPRLHVDGTILARRRSRQRRMASTPARCLDVAPASGTMHRSKASPSHSFLEDEFSPNRQAVRCRRIGRPSTHAMTLLAWIFHMQSWFVEGRSSGGLHNECTRVLQAAAPPSCVATRSKHTMQTPHVAPADHDSDGRSIGRGHVPARKSLHTGVASLFPRGQLRPAGSDPLCGRFTSQPTAKSHKIGPRSLGRRGD